MITCDLDSSVPDWIIDYPQTMPILRKLGIDISCGGKSLAFACQERGLDTSVVLTQLNQAIDESHSSRKH